MKFAPPSPPMIPARWKGGTQTPRAIVIHGTVSPCAPGGARSVARFFQTETNKTSAHYVVDPGEVIQCVGDHSIAYHCGYNSDSIGVELCDPQTGPGTRWQDANHKAMLDRAARLVADLCLAYDINPWRTTVADLKAHGPHGIYGHDDSRRAFGHTTHSDPGPDFPWHAFLGHVRALVSEAKNPTPAPVSQRDVVPPHRYPTAEKTYADAVEGARKNPAKTKLGKAFRTAMAALKPWSGSGKA